MKRYKILIVLLSLILITSCYDRDILDNKDGVTMPKVEDLSLSVENDKLIVSWKYPQEVPLEVKEPLSVHISIFENGINKRYSVENDETIFIYSDYNKDADYRVVVKLSSELLNPEYGQSSLLYSEGVFQNLVK